MAHLGKPPADKRLTALREYESEPPEMDALTSSQRATYEMLKNLTREAAKHKLQGATSDHDDMYDEFGLPR